ncbi:MAG: APC family permease, partial [Gemmatimonadaceae bacterium]
ADSAPAPQIADTGLIRAIGVRALSANVVNNVVGSGIFVVPGVIAATLGPSAILAYVICTIAIGLIGITFAEAGSRVSAPGGLYAYIETAFGPFVGFNSGVIFWVAQFSASAAIATVLAASLAAVVPALGGAVPRAVILALLFGGLAVVNIRGVRGGMRIVEALTTAKLLPLILLVLAGAFFVHPVNLKWASVPTLSQLGRASLVLIFAYTGVEGALTSSGEVVNPSRTVPRAILTGLAGVSALYIAIQLVAQGVLGPDLSLNQSTPLIEVAGRAFGPGGRILLGIGAAVSALGYVAGDILTTPRLLFAFGRDGFLPSRLGTVDPRHHTPANAIIVYSVLTFTLAVTGSFTELVVVSTVSILLVYLATCLSAIQLRRRDVRADGPPFSVPGGHTIPVISCIVVTWMLSSASRREFLSVGAVIMIASILYVIRPKRATLAVAPGLDQM